MEEDNKDQVPEYNIYVNQSDFGRKIHFIILLAGTGLLLKCAWNPNSKYVKGSLYIIDSFLNKQLLCHTFIKMATEYPAVDVFRLAATKSQQLRDFLKIKNYFLTIPTVCYIFM